MGLLFSRIFAGLFGSKVLGRCRISAPRHLVCLFNYFALSPRAPPRLSQQEVRILILGLDNAGKTTILNKLHSPDKVSVRLAELL